MEKFEFIGFDPTPGEKHIGILTVRIHGTVTLVVKYKIVGKKDGNGYFPTVAAYKMPGRMQGEEYDECFMLDSRSDNDQMIKFIMHHFYSWQKAQNFSSATQSLFPASSPQHDSIYGQISQSRPPMQPNPNYGSASQQTLPFIQRPEYQQPSSNLEEKLPF